MKRLILALVLLAPVAHAQAATNGPVTVTAATAWTGDTTVKVACKLDSGVLAVLPSPLPQQVQVPAPPSGNGIDVTRVVSCFAFRGTDPNAPTIRSVAVSDSQTFLGILAPPSLSH